MPLGAAIGAALFAIAVVLYILHPLLTGRSAIMAERGVHLTNAEERKRVALRALRDVEYDYHTGKLDQRDYERLRQELTAEAIAALEAAESLDPDGVLTATGPDVEQEIIRIREGLRSGTVCRLCAHQNPSGSKFCARCGQPLKAAS